MSVSLDERYFEWLYKQVLSERARSPSRSFRNLFHILFTKEFTWIVPNDDNRVEDGKYLRYEFLESEGIKPNRRDHIWLGMGCSFLEMLVALARRYGFEIDRDVGECFWEMLENIGLDGYNDRIKIPPGEVEAVLDKVIRRTYEYNGGGGLFPLKQPEEDQRKIEIWYQLSAYILERYF